MYCEHFDLSELPFTLSPNPRFVYLTNSHREALAHLVYGVTNVGGFVQITGEIGAGKTTICRTLLHQLPSNVDVVLLFNPEIDRRDLLASLAAELDALERKLAHPLSEQDSADFVLSAGSADALAGEVSTKVLGDRVHRSLLRLHRMDRRLVLIIDEAQNLSREVLESLRLLTNLETDEYKLMQIVLVGQPELRAMLARPDLRQLAQRITAAYHLEGMTAAETALYVAHRLAVAGSSEPVFSTAALNRIHQLTNGIPRLINVLCDRALLCAYAQNRATVDLAQVRRAQDEVGYFQIKSAGSSFEAGAANSDGFPAPANRRFARVRPGMRSGISPALIMVVAIAFALAGLSLWSGANVGFFDSSMSNVPLAARAGSEPVPDEVSVEQAAPKEQEARPKLVAAIASAKPKDIEAIPSVGDSNSTNSKEEYATMKVPPAMNRAAAEARLARSWGLLDSVGSLCSVAQLSGVRCLLGQGQLEDVIGIGRPAILRMPGLGQDRFMVFRGVSKRNQNEVLGETTDGELVRVSRAELESVWDGEYLLLWQSPLLGIERILPEREGTPQRWLRAALQRWRSSAALVEISEDSLRVQLERFQRARNLKSDGIAGPDTLAHLSAVLQLPREPFLIKSSVPATRPSE